MQTIMKSQTSGGLAPLGCSELWGEPLMAGELLHSSQPLPSCPAIKPGTHALIHTGTRTHLKPCFKCDRTYYSKLTPPLLCILLGACIRLKLRIPDLNFFAHSSPAVSQVAPQCTDTDKARFRHLQTGVLSTLLLPGVLPTSSRSCQHSSPALVPLLRHVAHRDQLTPLVPSHSPGTKPHYLFNLCP